MTQFLDSLPTPLAFVLIFVLMLVAFEIGFRIGAWREKKNPEEKDGPTGALVGSLLALMAFLLAITMGMAGDRFDTRRGLVQQEANAIGTAYLRAGYLTEPTSDQVRELLREYVPLRIGTTDIDTAEIQARVQKGNQLLDQAWALTEDLIKANPSGDAYSLFAESMNEVIDIGSTRATAINNRVPDPIIFFLICGSIVAVGLTGYAAGLTLRRSLVAAVLLMILFSAVIYLVIDLNNPTAGIFKISQQPLISLEQQIGPPANPQ